MSFESIFESPTITRDYDTEKLIRYESWSPSLQARLKALETVIQNRQTEVGERINEIKLTFSDCPPPSPTNNMDMWIDTKYRVLRVYAEKNWEFTRCAWYVGTNPQVYVPVTDDEPNPESSTPTTPTAHTDTLFTYTLNTSSGNLSGSPSPNMTLGDATVKVSVTGASTTSVNSNRQLGVVVLIYWPSDSTKEYASVKQLQILGNTSATWSIPNGYMYICEVDTNYNYMSQIHAVSFDPTVDTDTYAGATQVGSPFKYQYSKAAIDAAGANNAPVQTPRDYARGKFSLTCTITQTY